MCVCLCEYVCAIRECGRDGTATVLFLPLIFFLTRLVCGLPSFRNAVIGRGAKFIVEDAHRLPHVLNAFFSPAGMQHPSPHIRSRFVAVAATWGLLECVQRGRGGAAVLVWWRCACNTPTRLTRRYTVAFAAVAVAVAVASRCCYLLCALLRDRSVRDAAAALVPEIVDHLLPYIHPEAQVGLTPLCFVFVCVDVCVCVCLSVCLSVSLSVNLSVFVYRFGQACR